MFMLRPQPATMAISLEAMDEVMRPPMEGAPAKGDEMEALVSYEPLMSTLPPRWEYCSMSREALAENTFCVP